MALAATSAAIVLMTSHAAMHTLVRKQSYGGRGNTFGIGVTLADRYRMLGVIGKGGMGTVYLAEHTELGRKVAIKVLLKEWSTDPVIARRFRVEARTVSALGHPNIVQVFDAGSLPDGRLYLVMEHLDGFDLARELTAARTLDARRACMLMRQVALALGTGHRAGVVHRDVKPSNVMVVRQPHGEVAKVLDFGIAVNAALIDETGRLTDPGSLVGTPAYMAPEQAADKPPSPAFDIYAVGVMLYELLTGALPFRATTAFELLSLKLNQPAPSVDRLRPGLPPLLVKLVADCLALDPAARPANGDVLAARFDEVLASMQLDAPHGLTVVQPVKPSAQPRRGSSQWVSAALIATIAFGVTHVLTLLSNDSEVAARQVAVVPATPDPQPLVLHVEPSRTEPVRVDPPPAAPAPAEQPSPAPKTVSPTASAPMIFANAASPAPRRIPAVAPPRAKPAPQTSDEYLTERCQRIRSGAEEARRTQRWTTLRDNSRQQECWASAAEARKLQAKASMELGDFSGCLSAGAELRDPEVQQWLKVCQKRAGG